MTRTIKTAEVKNHNSARSVWIIIHNEVYDVTKFLSEHPGGEESLLDFAGKDGTQAFEDVGHSEDARILMKKYKIGKLPNAEHAKPVHTCGHGTQTRNIDCIVCQAASSCPGLPKSDPTGKTWRTFDGTSDRSKSPKADTKKPATPRAERRVQSIVVPRERRPRGPPCPGRPSEPPCGSSMWKWAILILGAAVIVGLVAKKYAS